MQKNMTIILIIIGSLMLIAGLSMGIKNMKPIHLNFAAAFVILIGTFFGIFGKLLQDKGSSDKSDKILSTGEKTNENVMELKSQNDALISTNYALTNQMTELQSMNNLQLNELNQLREENKNLSYDILNSKSEIIKNSLGGNSYGQIVISMLICNNNEMCYQLNFSNSGKSPLYDIVLNYYNPDEYKETLKLGMATEKSIEKYKYFNLGNVVPMRMVKIDSPFSLPLNKIVHLFFYIGARNGICHQELFICRTEKQILHLATKLVRHNNETNKKETLYENFDRDFPISKDKLKWILDE
jgi:hypothetical protein